MIERAFASRVAVSVAVIFAAACNASSPSLPDSSVASDAGNLVDAPADGTTAGDATPTGRMGVYLRLVHLSATRSGERLTVCFEQPDESFALMYPGDAMGGLAYGEVSRYIPLPSGPNYRIVFGGDCENYIRVNGDQRSNFRLTGAYSLYTFAMTDTGRGTISTTSLDSNTLRSPTTDRVSLHDALNEEIGTHTIELVRSDGSRVDISATNMSPSRAHNFAAPDSARIVVTVPGSPSIERPFRLLGGGSAHVFFVAESGQARNGHLVICDDDAAEAETGVVTNCDGHRM